MFYLLACGQQAQDSCWAPSYFGENAAQQLSKQTWLGATTAFHFPFKSEMTQKSELSDDLKHVFKSLAVTAEDYRYF